jgi:hypothetical protein
VTKPKVRIPLLSLLPRIPLVRITARAGMKLFFREALTSNEVKHHQRRANMIANRKQGAQAPLGLALDDIIYERQLKVSEPTPSLR